MGKPIFFAKNSNTTELVVNKATELNYNWDSIPNQPWLSYDFWCNSYLDWKVENHKAVAYPFFKNKRTAHLSGIRSLYNRGDYKVGFDLGFFNKHNSGKAGVLIGLGSITNNSKANLLIHNNRPKNAGFFFGCSKDGELFLNDYQNDSSIYSQQLGKEIVQLLSDSIGLHFEYEINHENKQAHFKVLRADSILHRDSVVLPFFVEGNIALSYSCSKAFKPFAWFNNLQVSGRGIRRENNRTSIVLSTFHNTQKDSLFLTAQLQPFHYSTKDSFELFLESEEKSVKNELQYFKYEYDSLAHQIRFRISIKYMQNNMNYEVRYKGVQAQDIVRYSGKINKVVDQNKLTIMTLNCNGYPFIHEGSFDYSNYWYPYEQIEQGFEDFNPELLVFLGDQFYESRPNMPIYKAPFSYLDYLYKWNIYCLQFRDLTASTPSIILTDDHDVYHSNLWGDNAKPALHAKKDTLPQYYQESYDTWQQDNGGYLMTDTFVNMAIRSQTSHLPQPYYKNSLGLTNYFTSYQHGKFDFAILEDKKFKSPPAILNIPLYNGQPLSDSISAEQLINDSLQLLGTKQLEFLNNFFSNRSDKMKIVLTQSAYACLTTVDSAFHPLTGRPEKQSNKHKLHKDMDTNGWPKPGRDKAMAIIGPQPTLVLAGDQHLGSLVELYDTLGNGTYFYTTPSIANTWPRTWYPSNSNLKQETLGDFKDGFGNKMKVRAVANPQEKVLDPVEINSKSPGFGIIELNKFWKTAKIHAYPLNYTDLLKKNEYQDWPVKIKVK